MLPQNNLTVRTLGPCRYDSPLPMSTVRGGGVGDFVPEDMRVLYHVRLREGEQPDAAAFELAGPRQRLFFEPVQTRAAIVTCGGLCPGINNVIRTLYFELVKNYHLASVLGIRFGFQGLNPAVAQPPLLLSDDLVENIHLTGGTILGTSRGNHDAAVTVDYLQSANVNILFCVGGDGTQRAAHEIAQEIARRKLPIAVIGIPKTIDNDVKYCWRTFGFMTAVEEADRVIDRAHIEATGVFNGVGLVKLMGREAGFIAAAATIASGHVNFTLIPELPLKLDGNEGLLAKLERRLAAREHAVVVVAEGAGQEAIPNHEDEFDASGNRKLADIGPFLKKKIVEHFATQKRPVDVKYFDPSYYIRSCAANAADALLCEQLARSAAHAAMAGKTDLLIGLWNNEFVHVPLSLSIGQKKRLSPEDEMWTTVLAMTGQEKW